MHKKIAVLPGDGIGPEVMDQALRVLTQVGTLFDHQFELSHGLIGGAGIDAVGDALPKETIAMCEAADAILFGSVGGPKWEGLPRNEQPERRGLLGIRKHFKLFANLRPSILYHELISQSLLRPDIVGEGFDILIVRELTGGIYFGQPRETVAIEGGKRAVDSMVYTSAEIRRIGKVAFETARLRNKKVTSVDKANVLDCSVLWREEMTLLGQQYPDVKLEHMYVDNAAMQLIKNPRQFDVIVTENLFGDILSDLSSVLPGSLGMIPSASLADGNFGLYEPAGGSAPDIAGQGIANPSAQILSLAMLLQYSFGMQAESEAITRAVRLTLKEGLRTGDIYSAGTTRVDTVTFTDGILGHLTK